jgi:arginyl-tRNA synthetase
MLTIETLAERFADAARALYPGSEPTVAFEAPRRAEFGDVATNVAFGLAKTAKRAPNEIAQAIAERALSDPAVRETVAGATPTAGFINLRLVPAFWQRTVEAILREGAAYGRGPAQSERISLEFGSANPTGPLVVVQGRTLSIGDTLAKALRFAGYDVTTEWLINDAGAQLDTLARSLHARYQQLWDPGSCARATASAGALHPNPSGCRSSRSSGVTSSSANSRRSPNASACTSTAGRARRRCTTRARSPAGSSACAPSASRTKKTTRSGCGPRHPATTKTA